MYGGGIIRGVFDGNILGKRLDFRKKGDNFRKKIVWYVRKFIFGGNGNNYF